MIFETLKHDGSVKRFHASNIHIALAIMTHEKGQTLIKVTKLGMPIGKYDFSKRRMIAWSLA